MPNISFEGFYFDGISSKKSHCFIRCDKYGVISLSVDGAVVRTISFPEIIISERIGNTARFIKFADDSKVETTDNEAVDEMIKLFHAHSGYHFIHLIEKSWTYVLFSLLLVGLFIWTMTTKGIPYMAKEASFMMPQSVLKTISDKALSSLDESFFKETKIPESKQKQLTALFNKMTQHNRNTGYNFKLVYRKSKKTGPNAFALPSGTVIITDELIELSEHNNELVSILAHEMGHVIHRHGMRSLLQSSSIGLTLAFLTGDVMSLSSLAVALPAVLVESGYSRSFEREADAYSYHYLKRNGIEPHYFVDIMERLDIEIKKKYGNIPSIFSTHPDTEERISFFTRDISPTNSN